MIESKFRFFFFKNSKKISILLKMPIIYCQITTKKRKHTGAGWKCSQSFSAVWGNLGKTVNIVLFSVLWLFTWKSKSVYWEIHKNIMENFWRSTLDFGKEKTWHVFKYNKILGEKNAISIKKSNTTFIKIATYS